MILKSMVALGAVLIVGWPQFASAEAEQIPDCGGPGHYAASSAYADLKNRGLFNPGDIDQTKTEVTRIAAEKIGIDKLYKAPLYRLVYDVTYHKKTGEILEAIVVHDATNEECSMVSPDIYIVSWHDASGTDAPSVSARKP